MLQLHSGITLQQDLIMQASSLGTTMDQQVYVVLCKQSTLCCAGASWVETLCISSQQGLAHQHVRFHIGQGQPILEYRCNNTEAGQGPTLATHTLL